MRRGSKVLIGIGAVLAVLIAARLALPSVVTSQINRQLHALEAYDGHVRDVDLALWRGAYTINDIEVVKKGAERPIPFFDCQRLDFSVQWRALARGSFTGEMVFHSPDLNLVKAAGDRESQLGTEEDWLPQLRKLFPFKFNSVLVKEGTVTFTAPGIKTEDAIKLEHVNGWVTNLTNVAGSNEETFAKFKLEGRMLGDAPVRVDGTLNPLAKSPTFDVHLAMEGVELPKVNPWLRQYLKADAESGSFQLYLEAASADGRFEGYAKPLMQHVDMYRAGEAAESPLKRAWEGMLDFANNVLENDEEDQLGARVPFQGDLQDPDAGVMASIISVLHNGFVQAFAHSLERSITLRDVKRDLRDLGEGDDDKQTKQASQDDEGKKRRG